MKSYLIIYKLGLAEINYPNLISYLKTAKQWARPLPGVWIIKTNSKSAEIRDGIKTRINPATDNIMVVLLPNNDWATSNIAKTVTDWMKNNL